MNADLNEGEFVRLALAGDRDALDRLVVSLLPFPAACVRGVIRDAGEDEVYDIVADAWLTFLSKREDIVPEPGRELRYCSGLLRTIVRQRAIDVLRHRLRGPRSAIEGDASDSPFGSSGVGAISDSAHGPSTLAKLREACDAAWRAMTWLAEDERECFLKLRFLGIGSKEIAAELGLSAVHVRAKAARAAEKLGDWAQAFGMDDTEV